jgi:hypothetical protein
VGSPSKKAPSSSPAWIYVIETGNDPGPLRVHGKPRVRVKSTGIEPGPTLDVWLPKSPGMKKLGATKVRYDLMSPAQEPGGRSMPFRVPEEAAKLKASMKDLREKLSAEGYTVNGDVEERARQHALGPHYPWKGKPKHSKPCHRRFKALRLDMLPAAFSGPFYSKELALCAESGLRLYFEALNYVVIGGQERYSGKP